jgi:hypothetical protein
MRATDNAMTIVKSGALRRRGLGDRRIYLLAGLSAALVTGFFLGTAGNLWEVARETGPMENSQAAALALAVAFYIMAALGARGGARLFFACLALLALNFLLREVDFRDLSLPEGWTRLLQGRVRNLWLGAAWLAAVLFALRSARSLRAFALPWLKRPPAILLIAGGVCYVTAYLFDQKVFDLPTETGRFIEELIEVDAALLVLWSAALASRQEERG